MWYIRYSLALLIRIAFLISLGIISPLIWAQSDIEFDTNFLRGSGYRSLSASDVKKLGSVRPGLLTVDVYRNDKSLGRFPVLFTLPAGDADSPAKPCIDSALFLQLGVTTASVSEKGQVLLKTLLADTGSASNSKSCLYMEDWVSGATALYKNSDLLLSLTIPQAFLETQRLNSVPAELLTRGNDAGFMNYNFNNYQSQTSQSNFLSLNGGFNTWGWQLRNSFFLGQNSSATGQSSTQYTPGQLYARRPLIDLKSNLSLGDVNIDSPIIGGGIPLRGVQMASEEGLMNDDERSYRPVVKGVARTFARVRVLQNSVVFFEQTVPPGPFVFNDLNPPSAIGNLEVVVTESDGSQQTFIEAYSMSAGKLNPGTYRYNFSTGQYRTSTTHAQNTPVVQGYLRYGLNSWITPAVEILSSGNYHNLGLQTAFSNTLGSLNLSSRYSQAKTTLSSTSGQSTYLAYTAPAFGLFQLYASHNEQSQTYVSPSSALSGTALPTTLNTFSTSPKGSSNLSLGINLKSFGSLSLGVSQQTSWGMSGKNQQYRISYSKNWAQAMLSVYYTQAKTVGLSASSSNINTLGASLSIPLEFASERPLLNAGYNQTGKAPATQSLSTSGTKDNIYYSANYSQSGETSSYGGSLSSVKPWGNVGVSASSSSGGSVQTGLSASGAVVMHKDGFLLSPYLGSTFAIVEVPQGEGASIFGSQARINSSGFGVMPSLTPYYLNDVQLSLEDAPLNLEIDNVGKKVAPVNGAIVYMKFKTTRGFPLLLVLNTPTGQRVPIGSSVTNSEGVEVGVVGQGSRALVRVNTHKDTLKVFWGDQPHENCTVSYAVDEQKKGPTDTFTTLKLLCNVGTQVAAVPLDSRTEAAPVRPQIDPATPKAAPVRPAITPPKFTTNTGYPLLLRLTTHNGQPVPAGATVSNSQGAELGLVRQGGLALVRVNMKTDTLTVSWGDTPPENCTVNYALDDQKKDQAHVYFSLKLLCNSSQIKSNVGFK